MSRRIIIGLMIALFTMVISCNKTPMRGQYAPLVGTWRWKNTSFNPAGGSVFVIMEADSQSHLYTIEITKAGEMFWRMDGEDIQKIDIKVNKMYSNCETGSYGGCYINMKYPTFFTGFSYNSNSGNELLVFDDSGFPYDAPDIPEKNVFIRMQ